MNTKSKMIASQSFSSEAGIGLPFSRQSVSKIGARYMPFSNDSARYNTDNLYPQQLALLAYNTPTHGAAIKTKQFMIEGQGFNLELLDPKLAAIYEDINEYDETANDILAKISWDFAIYGGYAMKVRWNNKGLISDICHIPFGDVRVGVPGEDGIVNYFVISNNWDKTMSHAQEQTYVLPKFNPDSFANGISIDENGIPEPTQEQQENAEQLIYFWMYKAPATNGMRYYPLPDYAGALDQILTEYSIGIANKSKIDNGTGGKTIVMMPFIPQSTEEQEEIDQNFKTNFTGADKDGCVIVSYIDGPGNLPTITQLEGLSHETYIELEKSTKQNIITAHKVPAILLEYNYGGGFNNRAEEMTVAYNQFQQTVIKSYQNSIIRTFKSIAKWQGFDKQDIQIIPFSLLPANNAAPQGGTSLTTN
jgi:hypothetical protein